MRLLLTLLPAALLLAACDASAPDSADVAETFEVRLTSSDGTTYAFTGASDALAADETLGGGFVSVSRDDTVRTRTALGLRLVSDDRTQSFRLAGFFSDGVQTGVAYPIGLPAKRLRERRVAPIDHFKAAYHYRGDDERTHALGTNGSVTFTHVTDDVLAGSFAFSAVVRGSRSVDDSGAVSRDTVQVQGTFAVDRAERRRDRR
jgi:hypothetical protein